MMHIFKKAGFSIRWYSNCEFSFLEKSQEARYQQEESAASHVMHPGKSESIMSVDVSCSADNGDKLQLCFKIDPVQPNLGVDSQSIMDYLYDAGFMPDIMTDEGSIIIWIYFTEDIRNPDRFLLALGRKFERAILETKKQIMFDAAINNEIMQQDLLNDQYQEFFSSD